MILTRPVFCAVAGLVALVNASPIEKRIAQVISDSTQQWVQACTAAGGDQKCGTTSQNAFMTLLANAGDCDQQNAADDMIDLAKSLNNDPKMIALTQVFLQQARNSPNKFSVNYCQQEPKNAELKGLFQCQFQGVDPRTFTNNVKVGGPGTIPLGLNAPLNPPGSCKAHPQGGIADGSQLVALTQDPGLGSNVGAGSPDPSSGTANVASSSNSTDTPDNGNSSAISASDSAITTVIVTVTASNTATRSAVGSAPTNAQGEGARQSNTNSRPSATSSVDNASATGGFQVQNGKDAQALNAKFASLTASSPCNEGDEACVNNDFAQCVGGKFVTTRCAGGTQCFALPLVNKAGTSIACTTQSDAISRIQASGAKGGLTSARQA